MTRMSATSLSFFARLRSKGETAAPLENVLYGHETLQSAFLVDERKFFHAMLVKNLLRAFDVGLCGSSDYLLRHYVACEKTRIRKTNVSSCQYADEVFSLDDR